MSSHEMELAVCQAGRADPVEGEPWKLVFMISPLDSVLNPDFGLLVQLLFSYLVVPGALYLGFPSPSLPLWHMSLLL